MCVGARVGGGVCVSVSVSVSVCLSVCVCVSVSGCLLCLDVCVCLWVVFCFGYLFVCLFDFVCFGCCHCCCFTPRLYCEEMCLAHRHLWTVAHTAGLLQDTEWEETSVPALSGLAGTMNCPTTAGPLTS